MRNTALDIFFVDTWEVSTHNASDSTNWPSRRSTSYSISSSSSVLAVKLLLVPWSPYLLPQKTIPSTKSTSFTTEVIIGRG